MKILVHVKRVMDFNIKVRVKSDGCGVELANVKMTANPFDGIAVEAANRSGNVWDNAAMERFFSSLKTDCTACKTHRSGDEAKADVFDCTERFSTIGYTSPMEFERQAELA